MDDLAESSGQMNASKGHEKQRKEGGELRKRGTLFFTLTQQKEPVVEINKLHNKRKNTF